MQLGTTRAQAPLTLDAVLATVICRYPAVRLGDALRLQSRAALQRLQDQAQPALSLSMGLDASRGEATSGTVELRAEWLLYDFGARDANGQQLRQALQALLEDQRAEALAAAAQAASLYATAQAAWARFDAAATNLQIAQDNSRAASARADAGAATLPERLQAETALAQSRVDHTRALRLWLLARGEIALAMGWAANEPLELAPPGLALASKRPPPDLDSLVAEALERHPRVLASRMRLAEGQAQGAVVEANRWGGIVATARVGRTRASSDTQVAGNASAAIGWSIPLFDRGSLRAQRDEASAQVLARTVRLDESQRQVVLQLWQEAQALLGARETLLAGQAVLEVASQALKVSSERFRMGVGSVTDLLNAQTAAANARIQWVQAQADMSRAEVRLAAASGRFGPLVMP